MHAPHSRATTAGKQQLLISRPRDCSIGLRARVNVVPISGTVRAMCVCVCVARRSRDKIHPARVTLNTRYRNARRVMHVVVDRAGCHECATTSPGGSGESI